MMRTCCLYLLLALPFFSVGQTPDSLKIVKQLDSLLRLTRPLIEQQKFEQALQLVEIAQHKTVEAFGPGHAMYATCLGYKGKIAQRKEKYPEAVAWMLESMAIQEQLYGQESPQYVVSMSILSTIYLAMGEFVKAEPMILATLTLREKLVGKSHPDYARSLGTLGSLYYQSGRYGQAEISYLDAKTVLGTTLGKKHPEYAFVLGNLSSLYSATGNFAKATSNSLEAIEILLNTHGKQHPFYTKAVYNLGVIYFRMGDAAKAEKLYSELLGMLNKESVDYLSVLTSLSGIYLDREEFDQAAPIILESEALSAKIYGAKHPNHAFNLKNKGLLLVARGDFANAETLFLQAHELNKKTLSKDHPNTVVTAGHLAMFYQQTNRTSEAGARLLEATNLHRINIEKMAAFSSEPEMQLYLTRFQQLTDQFYSFARSKPSPEIVKASFDNALFHKGFLLNGMMQLKKRTHSDTAAISKAETLHAYRELLTELQARPPAKRDSMAVAVLEEKANTLEKDLVRTLAGADDAFKQIDWQAVQSALKPGEAAVEFIHFNLLNAKGKEVDSTFYTALVLRPGDNAPSLITLFEARELTAQLQGASGGNFRKINGVYAADKMPQNGLYELIWKKLEPGLKGINKVYCSPSGLLHKLNLGAIPVNASETFADRRQLVMVGSTRQLVDHQETRTFGRSAQLVGGVQYAENDAAISATHESEAPSRGLADAEYYPFEVDSLFRGDAWRYLPGTIAEVLDLRQILLSADVQVKLDTGYLATEESIKKAGAQKGATSPRVLHFATHGYFFPDPANTTGNPESMAFKSSKNPLLRSGLIMAGAQKTWTSGLPPEGREDGVLTAQEISLMNLSGIELVVLSACETGLGDIAVNEGVYGLQRAFRIAGAKYIVMSLWKVNDQTTAEFMADFYKQWLSKGLDIPKAFQTAQRNMRLKYPGEAYHWAGFVLVE